MSVITEDIFQSAKPWYPLKRMWYSLCVKKMKERKRGHINRGRLKQSNMNTKKINYLLSYKFLGDWQNNTQNKISTFVVFMTLLLILGFMRSYWERVVHALSCFCMSMRRSIVLFVSEYLFKMFVLWIATVSRNSLFLWAKDRVAYTFWS